MPDFLDEIPVNELVGERTVLLALDESYAEELYSVISGSRAFLARHLPWPDECRSPEDVASRLDSWNMQAEMANGAWWGIFEKTPSGLKIAGCIILGWVQWVHRSATVSYWLGEPFTGRGLATEALNLVAREMFALGLNRLEISAAVDNEKSAALAIRCGFREEGVSREFERINGIFVDHRRFSRLAGDPWPK